MTSILPTRIAQRILGTKPHGPVADVTITVQRIEPGELPASMARVIRAQIAAERARADRRAAT